MLRRLHVVEEICVMNDARHVGLVELDQTHDFELVRHEEILDLRFAICDWKMAQPVSNRPQPPVGTHHALIGLAEGQFLSDLEPIGAWR